MGAGAVEIMVCAFHASPKAFCLLFDRCFSVFGLLFAISRLGRGRRLFLAASKVGQPARLLQAKLFEESKGKGRVGLGGLVDGSESIHGNGQQEDSEDGAERSHGGDQVLLLVGNW